MSSLIVNDLFDDLMAENKRLLNELLFANKCLNVLFAFKTRLHSMADKLKTHLDAEDVLAVEELDERYHRICGENHRPVPEEVVAEDNDSEEDEDIRRQTMDTSAEESDLRYKSVKTLIGKRLITKERHKSCRRVDTSDGKAYVCREPGCDYQTKTKECFVSHANKHNGVKGYECRVCGRGFAAYHSLRRHYDFYHKRADRILVCEYPKCGKVFETLLALNEHKKTHLKIVKRFRCEHKGCGFRTVTRYRLKCHEERHSDERPFVCPVVGCLKTYKTGPDLKDHMKRHNGVGVKYGCDWRGCDQYFDSKTTLERHRRDHRLDEMRQRLPIVAESELTFDDTVVKTEEEKKTIEEPFVCDFIGCGKQYKYIQGLRRHAKTHTSAAEHFHCHHSGCDYRTTSEESFVGHLSAEHNNAQDVSGDTGAATVSAGDKGVIVEHMESSEGVIRVLKKRLKYGKRLLLSDSVAKQFRVSHTLKGKVFVCEFLGCAYETSNREYIKNHMNRHNGVKAFECAVCSKAFNAGRSLRRHFDYFHKLSARTLACDYGGCGKTFATELAMAEHRKTHVEIERRFHCTVCDFKTVTQFRLKQHVLRHRTTREFKCPIAGCLKDYKCPQDLRSHMDSHYNSERRHHCPHESCDHTFKTQKCLRNHLVTHSSAQLPCDWPGCEYRAKTRRQLKDHRIVHSTDRNYPCNWPECGKAFKTSTQLRTHLRIHTDDKRYGCLWPGCHYRCTDSGNYRKHIKTHQNN